MKSECFWGALTGCLFYLAYTCPVGVAAFPVGVCILCSRISRIQSFWRRGLFFFLMYLVWGALQMSFLIKRTLSEDSPVSLIIIAEAVVLVLFAIPVLYFGKKRPAESAVLALLVSDFLFSVIPVGNDFFFIGLPLAYFTEIIQWVKYTGPHFMSLWVVLSGYFLYRTIVSRKVIAFCRMVAVVLIPALVSVVIFHRERNLACDDVTYKKIAVLGLTEKEGGAFVSSFMKNVSIRDCDCFVLPEGFLLTKKSDAEYAPSVTMLRRLSKRDSITVIYGIMTNQDDVYTNSVKMVSPDGREKIRYKAHLIPFSEYLPLPQLFSRIGFIVDNMPYRLMNKQNDEDIWILPDGHKVATLICYEALSPSFVSDIVRKGAEVLFVSSSCTWIGSNHFERVSSLLLQTSALITNRSVVRCARDGISMFVDGKGRIHETSENTAELLKYSVPLKEKKTFYVRSRLLIDCIYAAILLLFFMYSVSRKP